MGRNGNSNLWINLVGDDEGFEGDTEKDKQLLELLVGKASFGWEEEDELVRQANKYDYGIAIIVIKRHRHHQLRRKAA